MIRKTRIFRSNFIGVYCRVSEKFALMPRPLEDDVVRSLEALFGVKALKMFVGNSSLVGALVAMNSRGFVVSKDFLPEEISPETDMQVVTLKDRLNAMGNNIVMNDRAAIMHKNFSTSSVKKLADDMDIEVIRSTIGGIKTVGSVSVLSEKGMLVTPTASEDELSFLSGFFKVPVKTGTANFGSIYVGTSILANSRGIAVGDATTSIEMSRIDDTLS